MLRIFSVNLVRSILLCMLAFVIGWALNLGAAYLFTRVFGKMYPFWMCIILAGVAAVAVFFFLVKTGDSTNVILPYLEEEKGSIWLKRAAKGKHVKFIAVWFSLLIHLLLASVAVWLYFYVGEGVAKLFVETSVPPYLHKGIYLTEALASVGIIQILYFFTYWAHYRKMRCPYCKNVHCLTYAGNLATSVDTHFEVTDSNKTETVEFELDGHRYSDVGYVMLSRKVTVKNTTYARKCAVCGKVTTDTRREESKGNWEK